VLLVNSLADGMNLVSKEGPAVNERDGVLVLSRSAGSYAELGGAALGIDPRDIGATADSLHRALCMAPEERRLRAEQLRGLVLERGISSWLRAQLADMGIEAPRPDIASAEALTPGFPKMAV
jgi:trehalose 6-phosphate synthase